MQRLRLGRLWCERGQASSCMERCGLVVVLEQDRADQADAPRLVGLDSAIKRCVYRDPGPLRRERGMAEGMSD